MQTCKKCGKDKPYSEYYAESRNRSGLNSVCKACVRARNKTYTYTPRKNNKPWAERTEVQRNWDKNHPEQVKARAKRYHETKGKFKKRDPEAVRKYVNARRVRKANAEGSHTKEEWYTILERYGNKCLYPGCEVTEGLTRDHIIPLSKGGTDYITNIQPLCRRHNAQKLTKAIDYRPDACEIKEIGQTMAS